MATPMLEPHSFLWHYLWLAPHILQVVLAVLLWRRGLHRLFPIFFAYTVFEAIEEFTLYGMDVLPSVSGEAWWFAFCVGLVLEGALKLGVIGELFFHLLGHKTALAKIGSRMISGAGALLILLAVLAAAYVRTDHPKYVWTDRAHVLLQSLYMIECGLVLFLFLFAAHFKLHWNSRTFGIALGLGVLSCEHLGAWAVTASGTLVDRRHLLDFLNMATYHLCVLIWFYYFLVPQKSATTSAVSLPENNLDIWNRELERLLQQ
jgi:hypothetical protein